MNLVVAALRRYFDAYERATAELHRQAVARPRRLCRARVRRAQQRARRRAGGLGRASRGQRARPRAREGRHRPPVRRGRHHVRAGAARPAGFEAIDERLATAEREAAGATRRFAPGTAAFAYTARATTPGTYVAAPAKAEEMYSPETFGRSTGLTVVIE